MDGTAAATLFAWLDREIWLTTAQAGGRCSGLITPCVTQASLVPDLPRVLVSLARHHLLGELVGASKAFALHLLSADNLDLIWRFSLASGAMDEQFAGLKVQKGQTGSPLLNDAIGWLDCRVEASLDIGDRTLYVAEVIDASVTHFAPPVTTRSLMPKTPMPVLTRIQQQRQHDSILEAEAIRQWREERGHPGAPAP